MVNKNIITKIYKRQAYNSVMCGYFSIGFIDFMLKIKSLLDYTNLFSPSDSGPMTLGVVGGITEIYKLKLGCVNYF